MAKVIFNPLINSKQWDKQKCNRHSAQFKTSTTTHRKKKIDSGCSAIKSKTNDVMPKRLYVTQMFTTVWWSFCLDLDLNAVHFMPDVPLLCDAQ